MISELPLEMLRHMPSGCIEWSGRLMDGYGQILKGKRAFRTHRVAWEIANGPIPEGVLVCHHCDNRACCNVAHLFLGSPMDNTHDMIRKGRKASTAGELHGSHKLTAAQAREIHDRYLAGGIEQKQLAAEFGVSEATVGYIAQEKRWKHLWEAS